MPPSHNSVWKHVAMMGRLVSLKEQYISLGFNAIIWKPQRQESFYYLLRQKHLDIGLMHQPQRCSLFRSGSLNVAVPLQKVVVPDSLDVLFIAGLGSSTCQEIHVSQELKVGRKHRIVPTGRQQVSGTWHHQPLVGCLDKRRIDALDRVGQGRIVGEHKSVAWKVGVEDL